MKKHVLALIMAGMMITALPGGITSAAAAGEDVELDILVDFDPATNGELRLSAFQEAADKLGYKINLERVDGDTYKTKIRVMLQANELPDVFYTWGGSYSTPFLKANALYPLEDAVAESGYVLDAVYIQTDADGHFYAVPTNALEAYGMYYNKAVLEELGLEVPTDWEELLNLVSICNEAGIGAIGLGNKERWEGDLLYNMLVVRQDKDAFENAVNGDGSFTDEPFVKAAEQVKELVDIGAFQKGYMQASQAECSALLEAGKIALYPTGSWQVQGYKDNPNIGIAVFPKTGEEDPYFSCCSNAADAGMAVNAYSPNAEAAAKFVVEYAKILNDHYAEAGDQTFFATDVQSTVEQPELLKEYLDFFDQIQQTQLWWFTYLDTSIGEPYRDLSHMQFAGEIDTDDFITELETIMEG